MSKTRSVSKEWEFDSKGTEISLGKFVLAHFTSLTLDIQTEEWSRLRTQMGSGSLRKSPSDSAEQTAG